MNKECGCNTSLAPGQWWHFCGETDMGQTLPALCTHCGGEYIRADDPDASAKVEALKAIWVKQSQDYAQRRQQEEWLRPSRWRIANPESNASQKFKRTDPPASAHPAPFFDGGTANESAQPLSERDAFAKRLNAAGYIDGGAGLSDAEKARMSQLAPALVFIKPHKTQAEAMEEQLRGLINPFTLPKEQQLSKEQLDWLAQAIREAAEVLSSRRTSDGHNDFPVFLQIGAHSSS